MTSSKRFEAHSETCERCGGPMVERPAAPFPVVLQVAFGASFLIFLYVTSQKIPLPRPIAWGWTALQVVLGVLLMRRRALARHRVYRCVRCEGTLV